MSAWRVMVIFMTATTITAAVLPNDRALAGPPFVTDDAVPLAYQHFEVYTFSAGSVVRGDGSGVGPAWEFDYGLIPNGQVQLTVPLAFDAPAGGAWRFGYGDTQVGVKYRLIDEEASGTRPMISVYPLLSLPTGNEKLGLGAGYVRAFLPIAIQKNFGDWTTYGGGGYWINHGDGTTNRDYWYFGWLLQRQVTKQLAVGGEIFHQTATTALGSTDPAATRPATGFNIGAIYDFEEHNHLLLSIGTGLQNAATTNLFSWYLAYQITGP